MDEIERMQKYLRIIRQSLGLGTSELGEMIGVTRQTIHSIETGKSHLTKTQFLALKYVINEACKDASEDTYLTVNILNTFVYNKEV